MVPSQTSETLMAEVYDHLPFDKTNWRGTIPSVPGLVAVENFEGVAAQKRYLHNGGHFLLAAHGILRGYEFIWQCAQDNEAVEALVGFWSDVGEALHRAYGFSWEELGNYQNDLLRRFRNKPLADTVARVFRSPLRKLQPNERLLGAAQLCLASGVTPTFTAAAIATVLRAAERTPAAIELPPSLVEIVKSAYNSSQYVYPAHRDI
jgi:mannitol-1-phosphate 5-dehydrogenase